MNNLMPHVYFAEHNGEYYLSVLTRLSGKEILSRSPEYKTEGNMLTLNFSVNSKNGNKDWICRREFSDSRFAEHDRIRVIIDGGGSIDLFRGSSNEEENDYQTHESQPKNLFKDFPHIFSQQKGAKVLVSVYQKGKANLKLSVGGTIIAESPASKEKIRGYNTYSEKEEMDGSKFQICAEAEEFFNKKKRKKKKGKTRHSY